MPASGISKRILFVGCFVCLGIGAGIGYVAQQLTTTPTTVQASSSLETLKKKLQSLIKDKDESLSHKLLNEINAENIRENLRYLTAKPHLGGTPADKEQALELQNMWKQYGYKSWVTPYKVLLSYPDEHNPSRIELQGNGGSVLYTTQLYEKILRPDQNQSDVVPPFNAFSGHGSPKGSLVYVNYGRIEDFTMLKEEKKINFQDKICIARYGKIFRGDKGRLAEMFGCSGLILYTDPKDYNLGWMNNTYPDSWWMPPTGVQRGNVKRSALGQGDPLTPGFPSIESAYRIREEDADLLHIPVHPIGYGDALILLQNMTGEEAPLDWQGDLPITYRLGPGFENNNWAVQMFIGTMNKMVTTYNAFGMIKGLIEPDRYVLLGNHRDAWVFGAIDPSSGTAAMMELSRAIGKMVREGWHPRRSIIFCSWGSEEHGIIGSREWVEHYTGLLSDRVVAYLNVDGALGGNFTLAAKGQPTMHNLLYKAAMKVPNPDPVEINLGRKTVYDTWKERIPELDVNNQPTGKPKISLMGSGSDFAPFINKVGVTCVNIKYDCDRSRGVSTYPLYHSVYETFHLVNDIMDPTFAFHKAVAQLWGELTIQLADAYVLPYDVRPYSKALKDYKASVMTTIEHVGLETELQKSLEFLEEALIAIDESTESFQKRLQNVNTNNPMAVRMMNDQMLRFERAFINPEGLPDRPYVRNVVFAPGAHNSYSGSSFPGITDTLFEINKLSGEEYTSRLEEVKKQFSIVTFYIQSAAAILNEWTSFQFN